MSHIRRVNYLNELTDSKDGGMTPKTYSVFPFILRGVSLLGIDSQNCPMPFRRKVWGHLAGDWKPDRLEELANEVSLEQLDEKIQHILKGILKGRTIVDLLKQ